MIHTLQVCDTYCTGTCVTGPSYCMYTHTQEGCVSHVAGSLMLMQTVETKTKETITTKCYNQMIQTRTYKICLHQTTFSMPHNVTLFKSFHSLMRIKVIIFVIQIPMNVRPGKRMYPLCVKPWFAVIQWWVEGDWWYIISKFLLTNIRLWIEKKSKNYFETRKFVELCETMISGHSVVDGNA